MKKLLSSLTFVLFSLLSCGDRKSSVDLLAVGNIEDSVLLNHIEYFIEKTKGSRVEKESKFIEISKHLNNYDTDNCDAWRVYICYFNVIDVDFRMSDWLMIPCQKVQGKRVITYSGIHLSYYYNRHHTTVTLDSVFVNRLVDEMYPDREELNRLTEIAYNDYYNGGYPTSIFEFLIRDGQIIDSSYRFDTTSVVGVDIIN